MSDKGIKIAADIFTKMQQMRTELIRMGAENAATISGKQDILLGHMLEAGKDAMKDEFNRVIMMRNKS